MEICYYDTLDSTQTHLLQALVTKTLNAPILIYTLKQTNGVGSRSNSWTGVIGNLFFSFAIKEQVLPVDLPISSISIYFGYIIKDILSEFGSKTYLKWPNDLYLDGKKIGGLITNKKKEHIVVGVGLNLVRNDLGIHYLDINLDVDNFFCKLIDKINTPLVWASVFKLYEVEFYDKIFTHTATIDGKKASLRDAVLNQDGSITLNDKKVYSLR